MKTFCKLYKYGYLILAMAACLMLASCGKESLDYNHPDVDLFVKQLKTGKYSTQSPEGSCTILIFSILYTWYHFGSTFQNSNLSTFSIIS